MSSYLPNQQAATSSSSPPFLNKKISDLISTHEAANSFFTYFFTFLVITAQEVSRSENKVNLADENLQTHIADSSKSYAWLAALASSGLFAVYWLVHLRRKNSQTTIEEVGSLLNPWTKRSRAGALLGDSIGQFIAETLFLVTEVFVPVPAVIKAPIKSTLSAAFALVGAVVGTIFFLPGPNLKENGSLHFLNRVGRDGWSRYSKAGWSFGRAVGIGIGGIIGFLVAGPPGALIGIALGGSLGAIAGFGGSVAMIPWLNEKIFSTENNGLEKIEVVDKRNKVIPVQLSKELHSNQLYILQLIDKYDEVTKENYKQLTFRVITPQGKTKTAIITLGISKLSKEPHKSILYDIEQDPVVPFELEKIKEKLLQAAARSGHISPLTIADTKVRTKYFRTGLIFGAMVGPIVGYLLGVLFPPLAPLLLAVSTLVLVVACAAFMHVIGPKINHIINPHDQYYNTLDYGMATGLTIGKSAGNFFTGLFNEVFFNAFGLLGGIIGAAYDIFQGWQQRRVLRAKLSENKKLAKEQQKQPEEIEHDVAIEFRKNQPITSWSQRAGALATWGSFLGGGVGFLVAGPIGAVIGFGVGMLVGGMVGVVFGASIYAQIIEGLEKLGDVLSNVFSTEKPIAFQPNPPILDSHHYPLEEKMPLQMPSAEMERLSKKKAFHNPDQSTGARHVCVEAPLEKIGIYSVFDKKTWLSVRDEILPIGYEEGVRNRRSP